MSDDIAKGEDVTGAIPDTRLEAIAKKWAAIPADTPVQLTKLDLDTLIDCIKVSQLSAVYAASAATSMAIGAARKEEDKQRLKKAVHGVVDRANLLIERLADRLERKPQDGR